MCSSKSILSGDRELVQIVDAALADSARRSAAWLACRPGCSQCCMGVFAITQLDAVRLQEGLAELEQHDPKRAKRVRRRARAAVRRLRAGFPGDASTGILAESGADFEDFANDEPCPVLDPETGTCDLYAARPMTCRVFGPPVRSAGGLGFANFATTAQPWRRSPAVNFTWTPTIAKQNCWREWKRLPVDAGTRSLLLPSRGREPRCPRNMAMRKLKEESR